MLLGGLGLQAELLDIGDVAECNAPLFGPNPLMKVPTLVDGKTFIFESDHIAQYIVRTYDPSDRFRVLTTDSQELNARAVMNGVMATEVELILAARTGMNTKSHRRFDKMRESITAGLHWLNRHADIFPAEPTYLGFHLAAMWDHLELYAVCALEFPNVREAAGRWNDLPYVAATKPA
jgi:glutathione S-transferase